MQSLSDLVVVLGPRLEPWHCRRFEWNEGSVTAIEREKPARELTAGSLVVIPALANSHTHMGDSCAPDGATGLTLPEGFFRPHGFKYRMLAEMGWDRQLPQVAGHLLYMARSGTALHIDFREQGRQGSELLREASRLTGVESVILGQFAGAPFESGDLDRNRARLPSAARQELSEILSVADGFSESTMNDLTDPAWCDIRKETEKLGKLRAIHCLESRQYRDVSLARTGRGDLERALDFYAPHLVVHMTVASREEIALLAGAAKGPRAPLSIAINPRANASLGLALPPVRDLLESGVNLLIGTDNGILNSPNLFAELDFAYKLAKSQYADAIRPDPAAILRMATSNLRFLLGERHPGYLEEGLPATFAVLDFRKPHLRATRHLLASIVGRVTPADVLATYRRGQPLFAPGEAP
jgi:cytosine/adenosine deaminase-related metal-dependent hydrolase